MATKSRSKHQKDLYAVYKNQERWRVNRKKRLLRAIKKNPGNEKQITLAIDAMSYRRRVGKEANKTIPNDRSRRVEYEKTPEKLMFRLKFRAHDREGNLIWTS